MTTTTTAPATSTELRARYAAWREAALADGWVERPGGPWGVQARPFARDERFGSYVQTGERRAGDRSVALLKGDAVIWLVDRDDGLRYMSGWFSNGTRAMATVPEVYDAAAVEAQRGSCTECGAEGDPQRLRPLGFAGRVCRDCDTPERRAKVEFPGWTD